ncbi:hypothetical protein [Micromonospora sp. NPDC049102]|uniref:hypothetical protein n=1 Tax=Micromonospora sp. NPDC049102 TaxID=3364265 RepID=UPI003723848D
MPEIAEADCVEWLTTYLPSGQWLGLGDTAIPDQVWHAPQLSDIHQFHIDTAVLDAGVVDQVLRGTPSSVIDRTVYVPPEPTLDWATAVDRADKLGLPVLVRNPTFNLLDQRVEQFAGYGADAVVVKPATARAAAIERIPRSTSWLSAPPRAAMNVSELQDLVQDITDSLDPKNDPNACTVFLHRLRDSLFPSGVRARETMDDARVGTWRGEIEFSAPTRWQRVDSVESITAALAPLKPGSTAFLLVDRARGNGHAVAMYKLANGELRWADLPTRDSPRVIPVAGPGERTAGADPTEGGVALRVLIADAAGGRVPLADAVQSSPEVRTLLDPPTNLKYAGSAVTATFPNGILFNTSGRAKDVEDGALLVRHPTSGFEIVVQFSNSGKFRLPKIKFVSSNLRTLRDGSYHYTDSTIAANALESIEKTIAELTIRPGHTLRPTPLTRLFPPQAGHEVTPLGEDALIGQYFGPAANGTRSTLEMEVSTQGLYPFLQKVQSGARRKAAARHLEDGLLLGNELKARLFVWREFGPDALRMTPWDDEEFMKHLVEDRAGSELAGYAALLYSHAAAYAHSAARAGQSPPDDYLAASSRTAMPEIRSWLPVEVQEYLEFDQTFIEYAFRSRSSRAIEEIEKVGIRGIGGQEEQIPDAAVMDFLTEGIVGERLTRAEADKLPPDIFAIRTGTLPLANLEVRSDSDEGHHKSLVDMLRERAELTEIAGAEFATQLYDTPAFIDGPSDFLEFAAQPRDARSSTVEFKGRAAARDAVTRIRHEANPRTAFMRADLTRVFPPARLNFTRRHHGLRQIELRGISGLAQRIVDVFDAAGPLELQIEGGGNGGAAGQAWNTGWDRANAIAQALMPKVWRLLAERRADSNAITVKLHSRAAGASAAPGTRLATSEDHRAGFVWLQPQTDRTMSNASPNAGQVTDAGQVTNAGQVTELVRTALRNLAPVTSGHTELAARFFHLLAGSQWAATRWSEEPMSHRQLTLLHPGAVTEVLLADQRVFIALRPVSDEPPIFLTPAGIKTELPQVERLRLRLARNGGLAQVDLSRPGMARAFFAGLPFAAAGPAAQIDFPKSAGGRQDHATQSQTVADSLESWLKQNHLAVSPDELNAFLAVNPPLIDRLDPLIPEAAVRGLALKFVARDQPTSGHHELFDQVNGELTRRGRPTQTYDAMLVALEERRQPGRPQDPVAQLLNHFDPPEPAHLVATPAQPSGVHHPTGQDRPAIGTAEHDRTAVREAQVSIGGLYDLLKHVSFLTTRPAARRHLGDALEFGDELAARFVVWRELGEQMVKLTPSGGEGIIEHIAQDRDARRLAGYAALLYAHAAAFAQSAVYEGEPPPEHILGVRSRSAMGDIRDRLPLQLHDYLEFDHRFIEDAFVKRSQEAIDGIEGLRAARFDLRYRELHGPGEETFVKFATVPIHGDYRAGPEYEHQTSRQPGFSALDYLNRGLQPVSEAAPSYWPGVNAEPGGALSFAPEGELTRITVDVPAYTDWTPDTTSRLQQEELDDLTKEAADIDLIDQRLFVKHFDPTSVTQFMDQLIREHYDNGHTRLTSSGSGIDQGLLKAGLHLFGPARRTDEWYRIEEFAKASGRPLIGLVSDDENGNTFTGLNHTLNLILDDVTPANAVIVVLGRSSEIDEALFGRKLAVIRRSAPAAESGPLEFHPGHGWYSANGWQLTSPAGPTTSVGPLLNSETIEAALGQLPTHPLSYRGEAATAERRVADRPVRFTPRQRQLFDEVNHALSSAGLPDHTYDAIFAVWRDFQSKDKSRNPLQTLVDHFREGSDSSLVRPWQASTDGDGRPAVISGQVTASKAPAHHGVDDRPLTTDMGLPPGSRAGSENNRLYWVGPEPSLSLATVLRRLTDESDAPVIFLGGRLGERAPADNIAKLRRLAQLFALNKQRFVVVTEALVDGSLAGLSEEFGFSIMRRIPEGLNNPWVIRLSDGGTASEKEIHHPTGQLLAAATGFAKPSKDTTSPAVAMLLLAPNRAAQITALNKLRAQLNTSQARKEVSAIAEKDTGDRYFRGYLPLFGELGAPSTAEYVLDYKDELDDATARKKLLFDGQSRGVSIDQRVQLISESGDAVVGAKVVMEAVRLLETEGLDKAVEHLKGRPTVAEKQEWAEALRELAGNSVDKQEQYYPLATAIFNCSPVTAGPAGGE